MKVLVISDTHFEHENVIAYCNRPFKSLQEMNQALIDNWNSVVNDEDIVFCLGDFALGKRENIAYFAPKLKGHKILVKGNHDRAQHFYEEAGFKEVTSVLTFPVGTINNNKKAFVFSHKPRMDMPDGWVNIHGHIHDQSLDPKVFNPTKYFNASVENIDYKPIELQEIVKRMGW